MPNPFGEEKKQADNIMLLPLEYSTLLHHQEDKSLFGSGQNSYGELALGNFTNVNTF